MLDTKTLLKNRTLFLMSIELFYKEIMYDDELSSYILSFIEEEIRMGNENIRLLANYIIEDNEILFKEEDISDYEKNEIYSCTTDPYKIKKLYETTDINTLNSINELATNFCNYAERFRKIKVFPIRQ